MAIKIFACACIALLGATFAGAQTSALRDYSLVYQGNRTNWTGNSGDFRVSTGAVGVKVGEIPTQGVGVTWAFSTFAPFSLTFRGTDGESETKFFNDANFGFGFGLRGGIAYAVEVEDNIIVVPGAGWNITYSNYSFRFPGGATSFTEFSNGPFLSVDAAVMLVEQLWLRAGISLAYEPFHSKPTSNSGSDEDYRYGLVSRFSAGVRVPFQLGQLLSRRF